MTALEELRARLEYIGCWPELVGNGVRIMGQTERLASELLAEARRIKPALLVELLRKQAWDLAAFMDGDALLTERQAKLPELLAVEDRLSAAQEALWTSWRRAGFTILWSPLVEEFILVGDAPPPPGSEGMAAYSLAEVEALKEAAPERVIAAHKLKKVFSGAVRPCERAR
jgi:hypothetical protein